MAQIIRTDGMIEELNVPKGKSFNLEALQEIVGGWIEVIRLNDDYIMIVNEEGKLMNLPHNHEASKIFWKTYPTAQNDYIVGDVVYCKSNELK